MNSKELGAFQLSRLTVFGSCYLNSPHCLIKPAAGAGTRCPVMITHRADSDWETVSHHDHRMSSLKCLRTPRRKNLQVLETDLFVVLFECSPVSEYFSLILSTIFSPPPSNLSPISYARRCPEAGSAGSGGWLGFVQEGVGFVRSPEARGSVPPGLQNQHRPRGAAPLQGLLLQGTGRMDEHTCIHKKPTIKNM